MGRKVSKRSTNRSKRLTNRSMNHSKNLTKKRLTKKRLTNKRLTKKRLTKKRLTNKRLTKRNKINIKRGGMFEDPTAAALVDQQIINEETYLEELYSDKNISILERLLAKYEGFIAMGIKSDKINEFIKKIEGNINTISSQIKHPVSPPVSPPPPVSPTTSDSQPLTLDETTILSELEDIINNSETRSPLEKYDVFLKVFNYIKDNKPKDKPGFYLKLNELIKGISDIVDFSYTDINALAVTGRLLEFPTIYALFGIDETLYKSDNSEVLRELQNKYRKNLTRYMHPDKTENVDDIFKFFTSAKEYLDEHIPEYNRSLLSSRETLDEQDQLSMDSKVGRSVLLRDRTTIGRIMEVIDENTFKIKCYNVNGCETELTEEIIESSVIYEFGIGTDDEWIDWNMIQYEKRNGIEWDEQNKTYRRISDEDMLGYNKSHYNGNEGIDEGERGVEKTINSEYSGYDTGIQEGINKVVTINYQYPHITDTKKFYNVCIDGKSVIVPEGELSDCEDCNTRKNERHICQCEDSGRGQDKTPLDLLPGTNITVVRLKGAPQYNGEKGTIDEYIGDSRYKVTLQMGSTLSIKADNLLVEEDTSTSSSFLQPPKQQPPEKSRRDSGRGRDYSSDSRGDSGIDRRGRRDSGRDRRDSGRGRRDSGRGRTDSGRDRRDSGRGRRDSGRGRDDRRDRGRGDRGDEGRGEGRGDRGDMASSVSSTEDYFEGYVYSNGDIDYPVTAPKDMGDGICLVYFEGTKPKEIRETEVIINSVGNESPRKKTKKSDIGMVVRETTINERYD